ncbi:hypothetical protein CYMTET_55041 [Cymbomonas tetramitiformis]|uniref:Uncharacterized protein n=1 Tax=Cymbomonas tetramitiformis TaxID=36881 RepID=A0AAE0BF25_9CHLO|nr:hypothetical protein CYMTET_55041 [Cymbomonas tetramitiformis]|eukprot:gene1822-2490_t
MIKYSRDPRSVTPVKLSNHHKEIPLTEEIISDKHEDVQELCNGNHMGISFFSTAVLAGESGFLEWLLTDLSVDPSETNGQASRTSESMLNLPDIFGYTPANKDAINDTQTLSSLC